MEILTIPVGPLQTNCYIAFDDEGQGVVIDPGDGADKIIAEIKKSGKEIKYILLTHGHHDHIGAVNAVKAATGAQVACGITEADMIRAQLENNRRRFGTTGGRDFDVNPEILLRDGETLRCGKLVFTVMHTPGHTPGGVCYICGGHIFSGDTLFYNEVGRCDLPGGSYPVMLESLRRLAALPGDYKVYPGHDRATTMDFERAVNIYMKEALDAAR